MPLSPVMPEACPGTMKTSLTTPSALRPADRRHIHSVRKYRIKTEYVQRFYTTFLPPPLTFVQSALRLVTNGITIPTDPPIGSFRCSHLSCLSGDGRTAFPVTESVPITVIPMVFPQPKPLSAMRRMRDTRLAATHKLQPDTILSKRLFICLPHTCHSSAPPPPPCFPHPLHVSPHISGMKASRQAWRRHRTRSWQGVPFPTYTRQPLLRRIGGNGIRSVDRYEKEGNVSRHRPLEISNIWKKKLSINLFRYQTYILM